MKVLDEKNEGMDLVQYEDLLFGTFIIKYFDPATQMRSMKQLPHRHDDTIVCAYPKSGMFQVEFTSYLFDSVQDY